MSLSNRAEDVPPEPRRAKLPCETPGCAERCTYAYSCHEQRMGRARILVWPMVALAILVVIGVLF